MTSLLERPVPQPPRHFTPGSRRIRRVRQRLRAIVLAMSLIVLAIGGAALGTNRLISSDLNPAFVYLCRTALCTGSPSRPFVIKGATAAATHSQGSGLIPDVTSELSLALRAHDNVIELVDFVEPSPGDKAYVPYKVYGIPMLSDVRSPATRSLLEQYVGAATRAHLHIILNLSQEYWVLTAAFRQQLVPYTPLSGDGGAWTEQWKPYIDWIAGLKDPASGHSFATDPTIALLEVFDEAPNPDPHSGYAGCYGACTPSTVGTGPELVSFYRHALDEWSDRSAHVLVSSGGMSYLDWQITQGGKMTNDPQGIAWEDIVANPQNSVCAIEINSSQDRDITVPAVTRFCDKKWVGTTSSSLLSHPKPWFLAAWSACYRSAGYPTDISSYPIGGNTSRQAGLADAQMAAHASAMFAEAAGRNVENPSAPSPVQPAAGADFNNLAANNPSGVVPSDCDISDFATNGSTPQFPLTFAAIQRG